MKLPKNLFLVSTFLALLAGFVNLPLTSNAQAPNEKLVLTELVSEIADQQTKIIANQAVIDEKVAAVTENLRLAKIFVSRAK